MQTHQLHPLRERIPQEFLSFIHPEGHMVKMEFEDFIRCYEKAVGRELKEKFNTALAHTKENLKREFGVVDMDK